MKQVARNLTDPVDGFLRKAKYLIHDRDPLFTEAFADVLRSRGVTCVKIPAGSPNCNPHAERFAKTIKYECLNHFVFFGELKERFHQGLDGQLVTRKAESANDNGTSGLVSCRSRLGGMLNYYQRRAA